MEVFLKFVTVVGLGIIELWAAIPAGLAIGLHPFLTGIASALGSIVALVGYYEVSSMLKKEVNGDK